MSDQAEHRRKKGFFGRATLPVAAKYPALRSRYFLYLVGGVGALLIGVAFALNAAFSNDSLLASGPLSSNHASFGADCASCHTPLEGVTDQKCMVCHEKFGDDLGTHTFEAHYLYRSGDFSRVTPAVNEGTCFSCHAEHQGQDAAITSVVDNQCQQCHEIESFNTDHPEFEFAREELVDEANLIFPHALHVGELRRREGLKDVEKACLYCHNAEEDGQGFKEIQFDAHCDACHLSSSTATPFVTLASRNSPGVQDLQTFQSQQRAGSRWAYYTNPNEFQTRGPAIRKRPVYHEDPWVLANLRRIRNVLYPSNNLADLLQTSADIPPQHTEKLYEEAIQTLRTYAEDLRNQPDRAVQTELAKAEELLQKIERQLNDPLASRDETQFIVSASALNPALSSGDVEAYQQIADQLTEPCQSCHLVEKATIKRVQTDQQTLIRSDFNHSAHVIQARCLDCHNTIPIKQFAVADSLAPPAVDRSSIHNLPPIASCQSCHAEDKASNACITCHAFHPDKSKDAHLLLYVD